MIWGDLLAGLALYLVIEGALPFLSPGAWRAGLARLAAFTDRELRIFGFGSMAGGCLLLLAVRGAG